MSGEEKPTVVPVDDVSVIVQQLSEVSQHTTSASNAMRHLVAEIAQMRELRSRDATTVAEALAAAGSMSGSPDAVDNGPGRSVTTDPALRKLQMRDPKFRIVMVTRNTFAMGCSSGGAEGAKAVI